MRTQQTIAGLALFAAFGSTSSILWTGSTGTNPNSAPYQTCNETTNLATGPTGTGSITRTTFVNPGCVTTTTLAFDSTETITTTGSIPTETVYGSDVYFIDPSDISPTNGTATLSFRSTATTVTLPETTTVTYYAYGTSTTGIPSTITLAPPTSFVPVQDTLPNATYNYCNESTAYSTIRFLEVFTPGPTPMTTIHGPVVVYTVGGYSQIPATDITTNYTIKFVTQTVSDTVYAVTTTSTSTSYLATVAATTDYISPACAPNNYANDIIVDNGRSALPIKFFKLTDNQTITAYEPPSPGGLERCCGLAFSMGAAAWAYDPILEGCGILDDIDGTCEPDNSTFTAQWGPRTQYVPYHLVVGNGVCGWFKNLEYESYA